MRQCVTYLLASWVCLAISLSAKAENESQLKVAFIYNFTKFVLWPNAVEEAGGELFVCTYGPVSDFQEFKKIEGKSVRRFTLQVKRIKSAQELDTCHVLYSSPQSDLKKLIPELAGRSILTISDDDRFVEKGGIIGLFEDSNRMRFDVNFEQAKSSQLQVSSKLLQLARKVL